ncbi:SgcJ/EcaC family oxidoreductase [Nocardiopsis alkaliphila]|uniref:SgcJ/EcaC family oxidoreductase n=1 Tax=Nocardiopsis alkaliphila TaxID=225762 RepID=UPI000345721B|nr:SgcJ/EcaC family oxidoreductase [Nocardiopsis alkaliphila]
MSTTREHPEDVPEHFAQAWNRGDAAALADLFVPDADFVNVVGLWWRDREAIHRAHDYGLRVIFPGSTLRVSGTRVRPLGEDAAVVHCRWSITGQTGPDGASVSRRSGVFTFVVQRRHEGWSAVAAHNTDRVSGAETHVADEGGLSPADYRA